MFALTRAQECQSRNVWLMIATNAKDERFMKGGRHGLSSSTSSKRYPGKPLFRLPRVECLHVAWKIRVHWTQSPFTTATVPIFLDHNSRDTKPSSSHRAFQDLHMPIGHVPGGKQSTTNERWATVPFGSSLKLVTKLSLSPGVTLFGVLYSQVTDCI